MAQTHGTLITTRHGAPPFRIGESLPNFLIMKTVVDPGNIDGEAWVCLEDYILQHQAAEAVGMVSVFYLQHYANHTLTRFLYNSSPASRPECEGFIEFPALNRSIGQFVVYKNGQVVLYDEYVSVKASYSFDPNVPNLLACGEDTVDFEKRVELEKKWSKRMEEGEKKQKQMEEGVMAKKQRPITPKKQTGNPVDPGDLVSSLTKK